MVANRGSVFTQICFAVATLSIWVDVAKFEVKGPRLAQGVIRKVLRAPTANKYEEVTGKGSPQGLLRFTI